MTFSFWDSTGGTSNALLLFMLSLQGKLLYCHPPPGRDPMTFQYQHQRLLENRWNGGGMKLQSGGNKKAKQIENIVDKTFFHQVSFKVFLNFSSNTFCITALLEYNSHIKYTLLKYTIQ